MRRQAATGTAAALLRFVMVRSRREQTRPGGEHPRNHGLTRPAKGRHVRMLSTDFVTGAPSWLDLASPDTSAAADFYTAVFGWDFQSAGPEAGRYGFFPKGGQTAGARGPI